MVPKNARVYQIFTNEFCIKNKFKTFITICVLLLLMDDIAVCVFSFTYDPEIAGLNEVVLDYVFCIFINC